MSSRRFAILTTLSLAAALAPGRASAQLSGNFRGGGAAGVNGSGYSASVPLEFPPARGGLPIPVQVVYTEHGVGAAGRGWDVPLSAIRRDTTIVKRRPIAAPNAAPQGREQITLTLAGGTFTLVRTASGWSARHDAPELQIQHPDDATWIVYDGQGRNYTFTAVSTALVGTNLWLLQDVTDSDGANVHLEYTIATPSIGGLSGLAIDLARVTYNLHPGVPGCYKNSVVLGYDAEVDPPLALASIGSTMLVRRHKLTTVGVYGQDRCGSGHVRLREYQLDYQADGDTQQPRLQAVRVVGQGGASAGVIPVASYTYGTATSGGTLHYVSSVQSGPVTLTSLGLTQRATPARPNLGGGISGDMMFVDVTGDGRPDKLSLTDTLSYYRNQSVGGQISFGAATQLSDGALTARPLDARTAQSGFVDAPHIAYSRVWRQAMDINGDGRVDILDAAEQSGHWVIYLNTPDPANPGNVHWVRRSYSITSLAQQLASRGMASDEGFLPLARRAQARIGVGDPGFGPGATATVTEWEVKDLNGDGYPDVIFNSSRAVAAAGHFGVSSTGGELMMYSLGLEAGAANKLEAMFGILGTRLTDGNDQPFSAPVTLRSDEGCGVEYWAQEFANVEALRCNIVDVNGDGIVDRVSGRSVSLGLGSLVSGEFFMSSPMLTLPGALEVHASDASTACTSNSASSIRQTAGLLDITGDGIPDYVIPNGGGSGFSVAIGTGLGFTSPIQSSSLGSYLSVVGERCDGTASVVQAGWLDLDGDGKLDYVVANNAYMLNGPDGRGAPGAGRLIAVDNGFGARTGIHYRSIKGDTGSLHQVPSAEVVVDSVETTGTQGFGGSLSATRYAYGGAELAFDPVSDGFRFPGYRRTVMLQTPVGQPAGIGTILVTDTYAPVSALDPYGIAGGATLDAAQRYALFRRIGRTRDVTVLSGSFGADALANPSTLLGIDVTRDTRRIGAAHYEWSARLLTSSADPPGSEVCTEAVFPYDHAGSVAFAASHSHYDPCIAHGFAHMLSVQSWRGAPGAAPPSAANVETRSEITRIDDLGRVLSVKNSNDLHRDDDDLCTDTTFATPTGGPRRVLSAVATRTMSDCGNTTYTGDRWEYDRLSPGSVSAGHLTSHTVERRSDTGELLDTFLRFVARYDSAGNLQSIESKRDDGLSRLDAVQYDPFGLVVVNASTFATGIGTVNVLSVDLDPLTLRATSTTDRNGVRYGTTYDSFGREILTTITPPGGTTGALSCTSYFGFAGGDSQGRRIVRTTFSDPVDPAAACATPGFTTTVVLDELGRARREEVALGASYADLTLISQRTYDGLGRVVFEADPFPSNQSFGTAYGTTSFFRADGTPSCTVRGNGQQPALPVPTSPGATDPAATDEAHEIYPTCIQRTYQDHTEVISVRDAASLLAGSPQYGVAQTSYATAIGNVLTRSTWQNQNRLEHATFAYDRLGRMTAMTRYQDPAGAALPVTSSWHHDSLGQLVELDEPGSPRRLYRYSSWGELVMSGLYPDVANEPPGALSSLEVFMIYDELGRLRHKDERRNGGPVPESAHDYFYDQGVAIAPQVTPTYVGGRLAQATSATGAVSFSYDVQGRVNARVFTDNDGGMYVEQRAYHGDGALQSLDLFLPDTGFAREHVDYTYDSARRGSSVTYTGPSSTKTLYTAIATDAFGRVRQARYGGRGFQASYADTGRRLLNRISLSLLSGSRTVTFPDYDPLGRERSRVEFKGVSSSSTASPTTSTTNHLYDALGRLSSSARTSDTATGFTQQFAYDPLGNLTRQWDTSGAAGAPNATLRYLDSDRDRICRIAYGDDSGTECNVTHDHAGAIASQPTPTGTRRFGYLPGGSVRTIDDDQASAHLQYDAFGELQDIEVISGGPPQTLATNHLTRYGELLDRRIATGGSAQLRRKIPLFNGAIATPLSPSSSVWGFSLGEDRGTRFTFDEFGLLPFDTDYWPYGKPSFSGTGISFASNEQWNGGYYLAEFGLSLLGARVYDPAIGRFISRDPLLIPRTAATSNPYAFAHNDPVNASDPTGLCEEWVDTACPPHHSEDRGNWNPTSGWGLGEGTGLYTPGTVTGSGSSSSGTSSGGYGPAGSPGGGGNGSTGQPGAAVGGALALGGYLSAQSLLPAATPVAAEAGFAVGAGLGVGATVGAAGGLLAAGLLAPAPPGYVPLRCGDFDSACWSEYIRRVSAQAQADAEQAAATKTRARNAAVVKDRADSQRRRALLGATTFYHGTTVTDAANILAHGIQPVSVNTNPYVAGSFFTHEASQPLAYVAASQWPIVSGKVVDERYARVVIMTVPNQVLQDLSDFGLIQTSFPAGTFMPLQTVFLSRSFQVLNANATFSVDVARP